MLPKETANKLHSSVNIGFVMHCGYEATIHVPLVEVDSVFAKKSPVCIVKAIGVRASRPSEIPVVSNSGSVEVHIPNGSISLANSSDFQVLSCSVNPCS